MSDLHSISSNLSIKSNDDDELNLEERIGFKPREQTTLWVQYIMRILVLER